MSNDWDLYTRLIEDYSPSFSSGGIDGDRMARRLHEISKIGLTEDGGSRRVGFSQEEKQAKTLVKGWMKELGLSITEDGAGNVFGRLEGKNPSLPAIVSGSHLDSVPNGGHFDGPLGVLSSLELVEAWKETGYQPTRSYEVAIFSDEEGSRFNSGLTGSRAMTGDVDMELQQNLIDQDGNSFERVMSEVGLSAESFAGAARNLNEVGSFVEVHIEQGKKLEEQNLPIGIVSGIAGPSWLAVEFYGNAGHAGNTPMTDRQDALVAAGEFISHIHSLPGQVSDSAVATVGKLHVYPNGVNVIPGKVALHVDIRDIHEDTRTELTQLIIDEAEKASQKFGVRCNHKQTLQVTPVPIKSDIKEHLRQAMEQHQIPATELPSGAGHDALIIGSHLPVAMLFVKSKDGVSHNPAEWSSLNDCVQGVHVLKSYVESIDQA
ncbi:M20 family metallo-hydrolase [Halobacillus shinanisalinarum]|uniref:M20 family metallo-hydrolase n=1 Tax=Halobacillus shinanisalinarum TaxID=2932258 RepID=A0ABY4H278_9BACI|nr:M20 family metallo-hydrolase [Halobacillus shinanisalinarum]UOQ94538.1 M20 family metallo-hydrolase [Halobacillus shinanisalinarum]